MQGEVDALKAVTSGQWLSDMNSLESFLNGSATLLVYGSAVMATNASQLGKILLIGLLLVSATILGISNELENQLCMHGHILRKEGSPIMYARRLHLAQELMKETGRSDWAVRLGMVNAEDISPETPYGPATM